MSSSFQKAMENNLLLYCSSLSPRAIPPGEILVHRHFSRLKSYQIAIVVPEHKPPANLENIVHLARVASTSGWLWRLRRGPLFPVADRLLARRVKRELDAIASRTKPAVVLTTFLPDTYLTAAADFASEHALPLVLICHDDYEDSTPSSFHSRLAEIYRQASVRLCVSEPMAAEFERRYGARGNVLYPIPSGPAKSPVIENSNARLRIGFAGTVCIGYEDALVRLADAVGSVGGQIVVVAPNPRNTVRCFWSHSAVIDLGCVPPDKVGEVFQRAEVNALAVVQNFDPRYEREFRYNFPSKLTEYTTFGLPLLIVGPESASAVTWARARAEVAVISSDSPTELRAAVKRLADPRARFELAKAFQRCAVEFVPERLQALFEDAIESAIVKSLSSRADSTKADVC